MSSLATLFDPPIDATPEELRARLRALADLIASAPVPIAVAHDPACRFISANEALARLLGVPSTANISLAPPPGESPAYRIQRDGQGHPDRRPADAVRHGASHARHQRHRHRPRRRGRRARAERRRAALRSARRGVRLRQRLRRHDRSASRSKASCARRTAARTNSWPRSRTSCATRSPRFATRSN